MRKPLLALLCLTASATTGPAVSLAASLTALGFFPGGSYPYSYANGVSADGSTVVGESNNQAFRWTAGTGMIRVDPNAEDSAAWGASSDGSVVVGRTDYLLYPGVTTPTHAFRWAAVGGVADLGTLPGDSNSRAAAVSGNGSVVVGVSTDEAFRWTAGTGMVGLGTLPGDSSSIANGESEDGSVVVGYSGTEAFRWTSVDGMVGLAFLPGQSDSFANGISADGSVVVGSSGVEAFRWTLDAGMSGLGSLADFEQSGANGVSADGSVVVGWGTHIGPNPGSFTHSAVIWDAGHGMRSLSQVLTDDYGLDLTGWTLDYATGVSADGLAIVGNGTGPSGHPEVWIVSIPEPTTALLFALGLAGFAARRRRIV